MPLLRRHSRQRTDHRKVNDKGDGNIPFFFCLAREDFEVSASRESMLQR
jgi:hypothetical protein